MTDRVYRHEYELSVNIFDFSSNRTVSDRTKELRLLKKEVGVLYCN